MDQKNPQSHMRISNSHMLPQEELLEVANKQRSIKIGIPREKSGDELRIPLTPEAVNLLVENGNEVLIEEGAGKAAHYTDQDYSENGAQILDNSKQIFTSEVILKVAPPSGEEIAMLHGNQILLSSLNIMKLSEEKLRSLIQKRVTAIAFEKIQDGMGSFPVVQSMSEISGTTSILIASEYLSNMHGGKGVMLGGISGITPAEVVIFGASTAGEYAARAALGLGSTVKVFDLSVQKLIQFQNRIGQRLQTSFFHPKVLRKALKSADVLIGAAQADDLKSRYYITEEMIQGMKKGSVVIDLSIDRGGCIETSECRELQDSMYRKHGVVHYSAWNIPSRVARTASIALSNVFTPLLHDVTDAGGFHNQLKEDMGLRKGVYLFNGILTDRDLGQKFGILSKDLDLLLAAF